MHELSPYVKVVSRPSLKTIEVDTLANGGRDTPIRALLLAAHCPGRAGRSGGAVDIAYFLPINRYE